MLLMPHQIFTLAQLLWTLPSGLTAQDVSQWPQNLPRASDTEFFLFWNMLNHIYLYIFEIKKSFILYFCYRVYFVEFI